MATETYKVEITIENTVQAQTISAIPPMAYQEFQNLILQFSQDKRSCKVRFTKKEEIWLEHSKVFKTFENFVEFKNKAYVDRD